MIEFIHQGRTIKLGPAELFVTDSSESYRDSPEATVREIFEAVNAGQPWRDVVSQAYAETNPWLHRIITTPARDLFFRQQPPAPNARILDIGSGWGQIGLRLAKRGTVTALEPTAERLAFIRAVARQEGIAQRMHFVQADFLDVEFATRFDLICCIGVLEWVARFRTGSPQEIQRQFLQRMRESLTPDGNVVIGIENRMGLKYLLGVADDHIGVPDICVLDPEQAAKRHREVTGKELRCFTCNFAEYEALLVEAGFSRVTAYAALPDYKVPEVILPLDDDFEADFPGHLPIPEHDGSNGAPLEAELQDRITSHYRSLARLGISRFFVPSFFLVCERRGTVNHSRA